MLRILKDNELDKVTMPYIAMVENSNDSYVDSSCYQSPEFSKLEFDFKQRHKMDMTQSYPGLVGNVCSADSIKGYVIDSDGKIYNCWDEIGMEEYCCGDLMGKAEGNFGEQLAYRCTILLMMRNAEIASIFPFVWEDAHTNDCTSRKTGALT